MVTHACGDMTTCIEPTKHARADGEAPIWVTSAAGGHEA
jgi:hypothetical protein